ncbi:ferritin-like domain-containing protein [Pedobacter sp. MC2016-24]|uniref:YciE/YciF ferroxidase family protein n=1 Tax=Pedobacter sp. MC2016-24 TaxID=2780090 RepID=UPI00188194D2|nr:DUF892 family protein [Pedobacter sp. MC2016-24]MBE9599809.1 DUF892 family protein [Pedobacter sp. MC2016-24]
MSKLQKPNEEALKVWYLHGLSSLKKANEIGVKTTEKLKEYITSEELNDAIDHGSAAAAEHAKKIDTLIEETGQEVLEINNEIMQGIHDATDSIAESKDEDVRDLGVIASAQIALHYYISAYGGLAATANKLGYKKQAEKFSKMTDEMKKADEHYTKLANSKV